MLAIDRRAFLTNSKNWKLILKKEEINLQVFKLKINEDFTFYRYEVLESGYGGTTNKDISYRIKIRDMLTPVVKMTEMISLLEKINYNN